MTNKKLTNRQAIGVLDGLWSNPLFGEAHRQAFEIGVMAIKALEQEPKTGHWKRISMDKYSEHAKYWYRCDRCGKDNLGNTDWCPNCGCRMVEPQETETWNGYHGQINAPKGTFEKIYEDAESEDKE